MSTIATPPGVQILGPIRAGYDRVLTHEALSFVAALARQFTPRIEEALQLRIERQARFDRGELPDFLEETASVREGDWKVAPLPADILDRRVEITGPIDRKMIINALNSGASVFMADCEDATSPTWDNEVQGQINLCDAVRRTIAFTDETSGKSYKLTAVPVTPADLATVKNALKERSLPAWTRQCNAVNPSCEADWNATTGAGL